MWYEPLRGMSAKPCGIPLRGFLYLGAPLRVGCCGGSLCSGAPAGRPSPSAPWRFFPPWLRLPPAASRPAAGSPRPAPRKPRGARFASSLRAACARSGLPRPFVRFGLWWLRARGGSARYAAPTRPCARSPPPPRSLRVGCSPSVLGFPSLRWLRPAPRVMRGSGPCGGCLRRVGSRGGGGQWVVPFAVHICNCQSGSVFYKCNVLPGSVPVGSPP